MKLIAIACVFILSACQSQKDRAQTELKKTQNRIQDTHQIIMDFGELAARHPEYTDSIAILTKQQDSLLKVEDSLESLLKK